MIGWALMLAAATPPTDNWGHPFPQWVPRDVRLFVVDAQACMHFSGEHAYDAERGAFLQRMIRENCTNLDGRKARLLRKYRHSARARALIGQTWDQ